MPTIAPIFRTQRRLMQKTIPKTRDKTMPVELPHTDAASWWQHKSIDRTLCCARSKVVLALCSAENPVFYQQAIGVRCISIQRLSTNSAIGVVLKRSIKYAELELKRKRD